MKLTLKQLVNASESLVTLSKKGAKELPVKAIYSLAKNVAIVQPELEAYEKARTALVDKYSVDSDDGKSRGLPVKNIAPFTCELEEIQAEEFDLDIRVIPLTDADIEKAGITAQDLFVLDWMLSLGDDK